MNFQVSAAVRRKRIGSPRQSRFGSVLKGLDGVQCWLAGANAFAVVPRPPCDEGPVYWADSSMHKLEQNIVQSVRRLLLRQIHRGRISRANRT